MMQISLSVYNFINVDNYSILSKVFITEIC